MKKFSTLLAALLLVLPWAAGAQNVGIGTTSPTQKLDVNGDMRVRNLQGNAPRLLQAKPDGTLSTFDSADNSTGTLPTLLNGSNGTATENEPVAVAVSSAIAYVVNHRANTLELFDVSNPTSPQLLNNSGTRGIVTTPVGNLPTGVAVSGTTAYVVSEGSNVLQVFNVGTPATPTLLNGTGSATSGTRTDGGAAGVAVSGTLVYVVNATGRTLQVFDVSNPASPRLLNPASPGGSTGGTATGNNPDALAVSGSLAFVVNGGSNTLQVFDVSTPASPRLLNPAAPGGTTGGTGTGNNPSAVAVSGTTVYVVNSSGASSTLQAFDVSNPASPRLLNPTTPGGSTGGTATGSGPSGIALNGNRAYVTNFTSNTLQVFDVSTPASPRLLNGTALGNPSNGTATDDGPSAVAVSATTAYVVNTASNSLQTFRINDLRPVGLLSDGSVAVADNALTLPGDNLGNHTATRSFNLNGFPLISGSNRILIGADLYLGSNFLIGAGAVNLGSNLDLGTNLLVGNNGSAGLGIDASGNVGLGTNAPGQLLELAGQAAPALLLHSNGNGLATGATLQFREGNAAYGFNLRHNSGGAEDGSSEDRLVIESVNNNATAPVIVCNQNTNFVGIGLHNPGVRLDVAGAVRGTAAYSTSDARLKQQVRPLTGALAAVQQLRGVRYQWNELGVRHGGTAGQEQVGLLAQELEKVYPELVLTDAQGFKAVNYAQLAPVLIEALKELAAQNAALQTQATAATQRAQQAEAAVGGFEQRLRTLEAAGARAEAGR